MRIADFLYDELENNLNMIKAASRHIHEDRYLISFTKHDYEHSERMVEMIDSVLSDSLLIIDEEKRLNEYESMLGKEF